MVTSLLAFGVVQASDLQAVPGVPVTAKNPALKILMVRTFDAKQFSEHGYWYEDGSPMGVARPRFEPALPESLFVALRLQIPVGTESLRFSDLHLVSPPSGDYRPIASTACGGESNPKEEFKFGYPTTWVSARVWTTIMLPGDKSTYYGDKLLMPGLKPNSSVCLNLIYEAPKSVKALTIVNTGT